MKRPTDECLFCAQYLFGYGYTAQDIEEMKPLLKDFSGQFSLSRIQKTYYDSIAEKLRKIWPPGCKDGKYPWRDSVDVLSKRLQTVWSTRLADKFYPEEYVLQVARQYVSQFQDDTKYMKLLKYFILKDDTSVLADMLLDAEENGLFETEEETINISIEEGVLI